MTSKLSMSLQQMELGEPQSYERLTVFPFKMKNGGGPDYLTLSQAMKQNLLEITEISEGGSVPNLKVINKSDRAVLLIDGEELVGARQNRVLNTTILLKEKSETRIPVSCTEAGRWGYSSRTFDVTDYFMASSIREEKVRSVGKSVKSSGSYMSDQGAVWAGIDKLAQKAKVASKTGAMRDVFEARKADLGKYVDSVKLQEGQTGMLALIGGKVVGFDHVSRPEAFAELYPKLLKSYAMDAALSGDDSKGAESASTSVKPEVAAREFIETVAKMDYTEHDSVGYGKDYRFSGDTVVGSNLEVDGTSVHTVFFRSKKS